MGLLSHRARRARVLVAAITLATAAVSGGLIGATRAGAATPVYYVAMGDSLGAGVGASPGSNAYVQLVYQHELARIPGLQLENFSCSGATTGSVLHSHACGASVTQLEQATSFLAAHPGQIAFLTIDIGGNDVDGCGTDTTCLANGLAAINTNLPQILSGLTAAYPGLRVFGMNYYDPFLATWLTGPAGEIQAQQSVTQSDGFNTLLTNLYTASGFPTADVGTAFQTDDFSLTGSYNSQTLPQNVANVCNWTHMCDVSDFHADNAGHAVLAQTFEALIDVPVVPGAPSSVSNLPGNATVTVRWAAPGSDGGSALTGYVVTPYIGTTARAPRVFNSVALSEVVTGLANGTTYTFRVAAKNAIGTGAKSAPSGSIAAGAPLAPTAVTAGPGNTSARIGWITPVSSNGAPLTGYTITVYHATTIVKTVAVGVVTQATVTGLTNATAYMFKVQARNGRGASHPASSPTIVAGTPAAPAGLAAAAGVGRAMLHWTAPADNGAPLTGYVVTPYIAGVAQPARSFASTAVAQTVTGLSPTHAYTFKVAARNGRGPGPQSAPSNAITPL